MSNLIARWLPAFAVPRKAKRIAWVISLFILGVLFSQSAHAQTSCSSFYPGTAYQGNLAPNDECVVLLQGTITNVYQVGPEMEAPEGCTVQLNVQILSIVAGDDYSSNTANPSSWLAAYQAAVANVNASQLPGGPLAGTGTILNCAGPVGRTAPITSSNFVIYDDAGWSLNDIGASWEFGIGWGGTDTSSNFWGDGWDVSSPPLVVTSTGVSGTFNGIVTEWGSLSPLTICLTLPGTSANCSGSTQPGNTPTLTSVSPIAPQPNQTITLTGSGFGSQAPYNGDSPYLEIADLTTNWTAGYINNGSPNQVTLDITSWTNTQIVIQGFTGAYGQNNWVLNPGDQVEVEVWNPQSDSGPATYTLTIGQSGSNSITLTSVSPIAPQPNQTITLTGSGFGSLTPYNGDSSYLEIADLTGNWTAGYINNGSPNQVTLDVTSWTSTQIVIQGFTGAYGQNNWVLNPGDQVEVGVWNPQSNAGPATYTLTVGPSSTGTSGSLVWTLIDAVLQPGFGSPTVTGSFTYNANTAIFSGWSLTVSGALSPFSSETFTPSNSYLSPTLGNGPSDFTVTDPTTNQTLILAFCGGVTGTSEPLPAAGGTVNLCRVAGGGLDFDSNPPVIDSPFVSGTVEAETSTGGGGGGGSVFIGSLASNMDTANNEVQVYHLLQDPQTQALQLHQLVFSGRWIDTNVSALPGVPAPSMGTPIISYENTIYNAPEVFYLTNASGNEEIEELWSVALDPSSDTALANAQYAATGSGLVGYIDPLAGTDNVFYQGTDQQIHLLTWSPGGSWTEDTRVRSSNAPAAAPGSAISGHMTDVSEEVFYLGSDQHVHELWRWSQNFDGWHANDVTIANGTQPLAASGSPLAGFFDANAGTDAVFYIGTDQHVHEFDFSFSALRWIGIDVTAQAGAGNVGSGGALTAQVDTGAPGGSEEIFYVNTNQTIQEIWSPSVAQPAWTTYNVFAVANGAPAPAALTSPLATNIYSAAPVSDDLYYIGTDGNVHELWFSFSDYQWTAAIP
jgi:protein involved in polysaccharide export with SLBB domain